MLKFKKFEFKMTQYLEAAIKDISMSENLMGNAENMIGNLIYTVSLFFSFSQNIIYPFYFSNKNHNHDN